LWFSLLLSFSGNGSLSITSGSLCLGTVLGRRLIEKVPFAQLTALRFAVGMPVAAAAVLLWGGWPELSTVTGVELWGVVGLALVPGRLAIMVWCRGLVGAPASSATLAELPVPVSHLLLNWIILDRTLVTGQFVGAAIHVMTVTVMVLTQLHPPVQLGVRGRRVAVAVPDRYRRESILPDV